MNLKKLFKQKYNQCLYWDACKQVKEFEACLGDYNKCIVYQRLKTLDKNKPKTGLERFMARYGENWNQLGIGACVDVPDEFEGH